MKQAILAATELETRLVMQPLRNTKRVFNNSAVERLLTKEPTFGKSLTFEAIIDEVAGVYPKVMLEGNIDTGVWPCSMVVGLIDDIPTCKKLIECIMSEAELLIWEHLEVMLF